MTFLTLSGGKRQRRREPGAGTQRNAPPVRLEKAKQMLEAGATAVEAIG